MAVDSSLSTSIQIIAPFIKSSEKTYLNLNHHECSTVMVCTNIRMAFLFLVIVAICSAGFTASKQICDNENRFCFPNVVANWIGASEYCSRNGWRLAVLDSEEKQQQVEALAQQVDAFRTAKVELWIGASDLAREGNFVWHPTGLDVSYSKWIAGMPDNKDGYEHCVHLWYEPSRLFKWHWNDVVCGSKRRFVCELV